MVPMKTHPALYLRVKNGNLIGMKANYVDEMLRAGSTDFREYCGKPHSTLERSEEDELERDFAEFIISREIDMGISMDQNRHLRNLESLPAATAFPEFRSIRMQLGWLGISRANCAIEITQIAQVTDAIFKEVLVVFDTTDTS